MAKGATDEVLHLYDEYVLPTYGRVPVALTRGRGAHVWDVDGKRYLDFLAGLAVNSLGHCHPRVVRALQEQAEQMLHCSNLYYIPAQGRLAALLTTLCIGGKAFFCNSGAEAVEGAIKLARKHAREVAGHDRFRVVAFEGSFHGRTLGALAATGQTRYHRGFEPLPEGFVHVPFNDLEAARKAVNEETCAILVEPIQGEGGINVARADFLAGLRALATERNIALIFDEVQTGFGRTGRMFAYQHFGVAPDVLALAKGLGGGFPMGAVVAAGDFARAFKPGDHASTFGGNPLASAVAVAVLETMVEEEIPAGAGRKGRFLAEGLEMLSREFPFVEGVTGMGLMLGLVLAPAVRERGPELAARCLEEGLLVNWTAGRVLRMLPPLTIEQEEMEEGLAILGRVLGRFEG